jgi:hypothetical protein
MKKRKIRLNLVLDEDFYYGLKTNAEKEFVTTGTWVRQFLQKGNLHEKE